jgi:hypothetical protein
VNFCPCYKRGKWKEGESITSLPYNWPFIEGEFHIVEGCCEVYHVFQRKHYVHFDTIWYQMLIYGGALANWCHHFGICFKANFSMVHGQEFTLIAKLHHHQI